MNLLATAAIGFLITLLAILALRPLARSIDLVDRPGGHKTDHGNVPLVGGLAMFIGLVAGLGFAIPPIGVGASLVGVAAILVAIGLLDDRFALSHWMRLFVHFAAAIALIAGTGALVRHLGNPFGIGELTLHGVGVYVFTVLLISAAINAFNMLDGMDGLAGVTALTAFSALAFVGWLEGYRGEELRICAVASATVCGFLIFNVPMRYVGQMRCFMGDAGSTLLGALVVWLGIRTSQNPAAGPAHPVTVLWIVGLPVFELFWTVIRRVSRGRSPMKADREHFHHLLVGGGFSVRAAFVAFALINVFYATTGIVLDLLDVPDVVSLVLLVLTGVLMVRAMYRAHRIVQWLPGINRERRSRDGGRVDSLTR
jgi:UDP-GlcNAc:undecaprenyl-phosphate/decaprenyl-phosphate GlcNAc-1-phosphate transferase